MSDRELRSRTDGLREWRDGKLDRRVQALLEAGHDWLSAIDEAAQEPTGKDKQVRAPGKQSRTRRMLPSPVSAAVMLRPAPPAGDVDPDAPAVAQALAGAGTGEPLPEAVRAAMAERFGHDFTSVRIHRDAAAADAAQALGATAFTRGEDIFFARGAYAPDSEDGQQLLAHELTHVVQGYQGRVPSAGGGVHVVDPDHALEREADAASRDRVTARAPADGVARDRGTSLLRVPAAPSGQRRDTTQLQITGTATTIDYYRYMTFHDTAANAFSFTSVPWNLSGTWILYDSRDVEVIRNNHSVGVSDFRLLPSVVKRHVEGAGPVALGAWTLRLIKDAFYDDFAIRMGEGTGPGSTMTDAELTPALFNIRQLPSTSARVLGTMTGTPVPVSVSDKVQADGLIWYKITLGGAVGTLPIGTVGWVRSEGVVAAVSWSFFSAQLRRWEAANSALDLSHRITRLRQMCHNSDLPFDSVIGVGAGSEYLDTRGFVRTEWQILKDSQIVRMPDGQRVDVYHLLVGLDVLPRPVESQTYRGFDVGQNYSAATWSGDIGAGVADAAIHQDTDWETAMIPSGTTPAAADAIRLDHYYTTRAPDSDLMGDVDAWGVDALRSETGAPTTIEGLLAAYYGTPGPAPASAGAGAAPVTPRRRGAIERFLRHYGFNTASALRAQAAPRTGMQTQIETFARMWIRNRQHVWSSTSGVATFAPAMTNRFLDWLEALARSNGATVAAAAAPAGP